jgi:predicted RNA-binding protein YlxR (DUF448 family)
VGCRTARPQAELVRIARRPDGALVVGRTLPGRGAYLCAATFDACLDLADRRRALGRALRAEVGAAAVAGLRKRGPSA